LWRALASQPSIILKFGAAGTSAFVLCGSIACAQPDGGSSQLTSNGARSAPTSADSEPDQQMGAPKRRWNPPVGSLEYTLTASPYRHQFTTVIVCYFADYSHSACFTESLISQVVVFVFAAVVMTRNHYLGMRQVQASWRLSP
jgi:hypothetical protein